MYVAIIGFMKHPQTLAEKLYQQFPTAKLKNIRDYSCCALVFMWCLGIEPDDAEAVLTIGRMIDAKAIDKDCTVFWNKACEYLTGRSCDVEFREITSIRSIKDRTPVRYDYNGHSHWVGVENGKVEFNTLAHSVCVAKGKPVTARIIKIKGGK